MFVALKDCWLSRDPRVAQGRHGDQGVGDKQNVCGHHPITPSFAGQTEVEHAHADHDGNAEERRDAIGNA